MNKSIFCNRLKSFALKAIEIDRTTLPTAHAVRADGTNMTNEERVLMCAGHVLTSLCGGVTHNLKSPGAACTPQSVASIQASFRWAMSFISTTSRFEELYSDISSEPDYVTDLYRCFLPMTHTNLVGTIATIGIDTDYTDEEYCTEQLTRWSYTVCVNILAFCAARDINPFE